MAALACVTLRVAPGSEVERKFVATPEAVRGLLSAMAHRVAPVVYDSARPVAYARTTYLDTDGLDYFRSGDGRGPQVRLRVREYAAARGTLDEPVLTGHCFLELKENVGALRRKVRFTAPPRAMERLVRTHGASARELPPGLAPTIALRLWRDRPEPRVTTWYRRASFIDARGSIRITVDDAVQISGPCWPGQAGEEAKPPEALAAVPGTIVELKYRGRPPDWLAHAVTCLARTTGLSKFLISMRALGYSPLEKRNG